MALKEELKGRTGSSPRGRGKLQRVAVVVDPLGLIPARAGKTATCQRSASRGGAHPRAGGENAEGWEAGGAISGSSPRGRGKHRRRIRMEAPRRLIPARAGKTRAGTTANPSGSAHPRAGGENVSSMTRTLFASGSSPRGRGKRSRALQMETRPRLIPARAGKTIDREPTLIIARAHPRAGGENGGAGSVGFSSPGSSPRGRGKRPPSSGGGPSSRLIPARAGKTKTMAHQ